MHRLKALSKNLSLNLSLNEEIPEYILGDGLRIKQVITNLVSNAIKFTPDSGQIEVVADLKDDGKKLQIAISDTGVGIPKSKGKLIFEPFRQADSSTTRQYGGTGLGLTISKKIADQSGGQLYFENNLTQGTTFFFEIPCKPAEPRLKVNKNNPELATQAKGRDLSKLNVLVAEDNLINQKVVVQLLKRYKIDPEIVENGEAVIASLAEGKRFDLILMDCQMPIMNGYEATREIRFKESDSNTRQHIIAMTANALEGDRELCLDSGMDDYISKPLRSASFQELIYRWYDLIVKTEK